MSEKQYKQKNKKNLKNSKHYKVANFLKTKQNKINSNTRDWKVNLYT